MTNEERIIICQDLNDYHVGVIKKCKQRIEKHEKMIIENQEIISGLKKPEQEQT